MSEKVKLTKEQAEAVAIRKNMNMFEESVRCHIYGRFTGDTNKALAELSLDEFIRALYIGYEVEETFEVGDCVVLDDGQIVEIIEDWSCTVVVAWIISGQMYRGQINKSLIKRHATKQEKWWAKHGREVWELKENDLLYYDDEFKEVEEVSEIGAIMLSSERVYLPLETIKSKYSVACFADDRKDIDGGDIE